MCCLSRQRPGQEQFGLRPSQYRTILHLYALRRIAFQPQPRRTHAPTYSAHRCCCLALVMTIIQVLRQRLTALADLVSPLQNYQYTRSPRVKPTCVCLPGQPCLRLRSCPTALKSSYNHMSSHTIARSYRCPAERPSHFVLPQARTISSRSQRSRCQSSRCTCKKYSPLSVALTYSL